LRFFAPAKAAELHRKGQSQKGMGLELHGHHFHAGRKAQFAEKLFAIIPGESKRADIRDSETGDDLGERGGIRFGEFAVHQRALRPIHQLRQRDVVVQIRGDLVGDGLFRDCHGGNLHFLVAFIHWEFFMRLNQFASVVVNLLRPTATGALALAPISSRRLDTTAMTRTQVAMDQRFAKIRKKIRVFSLTVLAYMLIS